MTIVVVSLKKMKGFGKNMSNFFYNFLYGAKDKQIAELKATCSSNLNLISELERQNNDKGIQIINLKGVVSELNADIAKLNQEVNSILLQKSIYDVKQPEWTTLLNPFPYFTIDGLRIRPNVLCNPNSVELKRVVYSVGLKKPTLKETADAVEKWINARIKYVQDVDNQLHLGMAEEYQNSEYTFIYGKGDCDDYSILFYTVMMMLGYGNEVIGEAGDVKIDGSELGHMYNRVLIDGDWKIYDSCIIQKEKLCKYPDKKDAWFAWNYAGTYIFK
jgi:hypothetical protein